MKPLQTHSPTPSPLASTLTFTYLHSLDGTPTLNQWVLVEEGGASPSVITIECCGILVGSTSEEIVEHIRLSWQTGQECVELLRDALGPELANMYGP